MTPEQPLTTLVASLAEDLPLMRADVVFQAERAERRTHLPPINALIASWVNGERSSGSCLPSQSIIESSSALRSAAKRPSASASSLSRLALASAKRFSSALAVSVKLSFSAGFAFAGAAPGFVVF